MQFVSIFTKTMRGIYVVSLEIKIVLKDCFYTLRLTFDYVSMSLTLSLAGRTGLPYKIIYHDIALVFTHTATSLKLFVHNLSLIIPNTYSTQI